MTTCDRCGSDEARNRWRVDGQRTALLCARCVSELVKVERRGIAWVSEVVTS